MNSELPASLSISIDGGVATVLLNRAEKRNALDDATVQGLGRWFADPPPEVKVAVLGGEGAHFSAGLDLGSLTETSTFEGIAHSAMWHRVFNQIEYGPFPVVSALQGAVIGGGLELASSTHIRVADSSTFYALPEGQRGLFVGGGASVRVSRLIGVARMTDLMLTGRVLTADEGYSLGLSQYLVDEGKAMEKAQELAAAIVTNSPITNYAVTHVLPRIGEIPPAEGFMMESLIAAISQGSDDTKARLNAFLEGRAAKVAPGWTTAGNNEGGDS